MPLDRVRPAEALSSRFVLLQVHLAQAFVVPDFPVFNPYSLCLVVHIDCRFVFAQKVAAGAWRVNEYGGGVTVCSRKELTVICRLALNCTRCAGLGTLLPGTAAATPGFSLVAA